MSVAQPSPDNTAPVRTTKETHPNLPPGLILGPDGKPCKVCNSWQDWAKLKVKKKATSEGQGASEGKGSGAGAAAGMSAFAGMMSGVNTSKTAPPKEEKAVDRSSCPPDTAQLGRSTWTFLHTTAAYYPLSAPANTQNQMLNLLSSLSLLYPCSWCATDFQKDMRSNPPDVSGREGLMKWLCERHNEVNLKLGKERFGCDVKNLDERWKDGPADGRCD